MTNQNDFTLAGAPSANTSAQNRWLFWACFASLIATSVAFSTRMALLGKWGDQFNLSGEQVGQIQGAGIWPFGISIVLFSLVVDRIGYKTAMIFAFLSHIAYGIIVICAPMALAGAGASQAEIDAGRKTAYWLLYGGSVILGLSNGTVEAVINPVVATMFSREKVRWLNILHAGWPAGLVGGGLLVVALAGLDWQWTIAMIFIPAIIYGPMMVFAKFPPNERVAAGHSYLGMLKEFGILASILVVPLVIRQLCLVFLPDELSKQMVAGMSVATLIQLLISLAIIIGFGIVVRGSPGRLMLFVMMLIMMPLATTELGTDAWITTLMEQPLKAIGLHAVLVLVYTSLIMMLLRFFAAGPIAHKLSPLGLLAISAALAACGLSLMSASTGWAIFAAATVFALGKTFFWPTMLGVVSEQCPKGGALTINAVGGMGMVAVGVLGGPFIGLLQDNAIDRHLLTEHPAIHKVVMVEKSGMFGKYQAVDQDKAKTLTKEQKDTLDKIDLKAKRTALGTIAIFPCIMLGGYLLMILYFRSKGGYKPVVLTKEAGG